MTKREHKKTIIDSVHRNIWIEDSLFKDFIDTPNFQRLRRIEQSAIRSVYPCARHDRFTHSLGVFHLGTQIAQHLLYEASYPIYNPYKKRSNRGFYNYGIERSDLKKIVDSYCIACLMHDIAHAPFSHTFEKCYGTKAELARLLIHFIPSIDVDLNESSWGSSKEHELASAIVCACDFSEAIQKHNASVELVARMIIGLKYKATTEPYNQIANCFITLLNGNTFDADKLDYVCRDVWASGYNTSSINIGRLIAATHICYSSDEGTYVVCFDSKVTNEIASIISVKNFQAKYVINHHTVQYDQYILQEAVSNGMRQKLQENEYKFDDPLATEADPAKQLIHIENVIQHKEKLPADFQHTRYTCNMVSDDDLVHIIKKHESEIGREWLYRQYKMVPLWKSTDEFVRIFRGLSRPKDIDSWRKIVMPVLQNKPMGYVVGFSLNRYIDLSDINILVNNLCMKYDSLYPKSKVEDECYANVYVNRDYILQMNNTNLQGGISSLLELIRTALPTKNDN